MFEFGSNIALYLGMICVIAVLFFFIKRQITETENKLNNMMEVITGLSMEFVHLKTMVMTTPVGGGARDITKLNESMIISDDEEDDEVNDEDNNGYEQDEQDEESDEDSESEESDEDDDDEDDDDEDDNDEDDEPEVTIDVVKIEEEVPVKVQVEEIEPKTITIDLTSKLPKVVTDYNKFNMKKLKDFCIDKGISAEYSKLKKADLVKLLEDFDAESEEECQPHSEPEEEEDEEEDEEEEEEEENIESGDDINLEEEILVTSELDDLILKDDEGETE
jgi:hypothetical protein